MQLYIHQFLFLSEQLHLTLPEAPSLHEQVWFDPVFKAVPGSSVLKLHLSLLFLCPGNLSVQNTWLLGPLLHALSSWSSLQCQQCFSCLVCDGRSQARLQSFSLSFFLFPLIHPSFVLFPFLTTSGLQSRRPQGSCIPQGRIHVGRVAVIAETVFSLLCMILLSFLMGHVGLLLFPALEADW